MTQEERRALWVDLFKHAMSHPAEPVTVQDAAAAVDLIMIEIDRRFPPQPSKVASGAPGGDLPGDVRIGRLLASAAEDFGFMICSRGTMTKVTAEDGLGLVRRLRRKAIEVRTTTPFEARACVIEEAIPVFWGHLDALNWATVGRHDDHMDLARKVLDQLADLGVMIDARIPF